MDLNTDLDELARGIAAWMRRNIKWFTTPPLIALLLMVVIHHWVPQVLDWFSENIGLARPSLAEVLSFACLLFIVERMVSVERVLTEGHGLTAFDTREDAYRHLLDARGGRTFRQVDLVQYSGQTAIQLLGDVARLSPQARVRLLLQDPQCVHEFDTDGIVNHAERIDHTLEQIWLLEEDHAPFHVDVGYYQTPPGPSTLVIDDIVVFGVYHTYVEEGIVRLRGHNAPAVVGEGRDASVLRQFARRHFDSLWLEWTQDRDAAESVQQALPADSRER